MRQRELMKLTKFNTFKDKNTTYLPHCCSDKGVKLEITLKIELKTLYLESYLKLCTKSLFKLLSCN